MKPMKSLFALLTLVAISFACAPVNDHPVATPTNDQPEVTTEQTAFPWDTNDASCCQQRPILERPKI